MDVAMPDLYGIDAATETRTLLPRARVIALTMHSDKNYLIGMLRATTVGYLLKDCASDYSGKAPQETSEPVAYFVNSATVNRFKFLHNLSAITIDRFPADLHPFGDVAEIHSRKPTTACVKEFRR